MTPPRIIGVVGCGNMGGAILKGFKNSPAMQAYALLAYDINAEKRNKLNQEGFRLAESLEQLAQESDIIILAVKPGHIKDALSHAKPGLNANKIIISIAAGVTIRNLEMAIAMPAHFIRCMPTTTALAGHGIFAFCFEGSDLERKEQEGILELFGHIGYCLTLPESRFTAYTALIGAGPAYVYECMQGLAQAGLTLGFTQEESRKMLIELFAGSAALAKIQTQNFAQLRDNVCSPAGITIAGINILDKAGFTGLLVEAVEAANRRGLEMES